MATFKHRVHPGVDITGLPIELVREPGVMGEYGVSMQPIVTIGTALAPGTLEVPFWRMPYRTRSPLSEVGPAPSPAHSTVTPSGEPYRNVVVSPDAPIKTTEGTKPRAPVEQPGKERKVIAGKMFPIIYKVIGGVTEAADWIKALHDALPKQYQAKPSKYQPGEAQYTNPSGRPKADSKWKPSTPQDKLAALYANWDKVDLGKALANVIMMEAQDRAIGKTNQAIHKGFRDHYRQRKSVVGVTTGPAL